MSWWVEFSYDDRGYGNVLVASDTDEGLLWRARTGSINASGNLVNACPTGNWFIIDQSAPTTEDAMVVDGFGRKSRMYRKDEEGNYIYTHYLFHPDGGKPGSAGCVVTLSNHAEFFRFIDRIISDQTELPVLISKDDAWEN